MEAVVMGAFIAGGVGASAVARGAAGNRIHAARGVLAPATLCAAAGVVLASLLADRCRLSAARLTL